jgi:hypothetical protein
MPKISDALSACGAIVNLALRDRCTQEQHGGDMRNIRNIVSEAGEIVAKVTGDGTTPHRGGG